MKDSFSTYHPVVNLLFFVCVLTLSMVLMHPVCLGISFVAAFAYALYINGKKTLRFGLLFMLPMLLITALINPAFRHEGATILAYLPGGNPLTLESMLYGLAAAVMLLAVINWFSCVNAVMTSDKFVYLFGRVIPALSLVLSMSLRLVPRFKAQIKAISAAQSCVGRDVSNGGVLARARHGLRILSIMVTWAFENAIETADSMKSRGYGLAGRTAFSVFRFDARDGAALMTLLALAAYVIAGSVSGGLAFRYYPTLKAGALNAFTVSLFMAYAALCVLPLILNINEDAKWKAIKSTI